LQILAEKRIVEKLKIKRFFNAVGMEENKDDNNWQSQLFFGQTLDYITPFYIQT
jgi:hypothetical protein